MSWSISSASATLSGYPVLGGLSLRAEVDPDHIGIWGSSYSGGHVLHLASFDQRIKAAVAQVPLVNGWGNAQRLMRPDVFDEFLVALAHDRAQRYAGEERQGAGGGSRGRTFGAADARVL